MSYNIDLNLSLSPAITNWRTQRPISRLNPTHISKLISSLSVSPHPEGGYYCQTHTGPVETPLPETQFQANSVEGPKKYDVVGGRGRPSSSTIFYLLTPSSPVGRFHRHDALTVHAWHKGRGRYVLIYEDEGGDESSCNRDGLDTWESRRKEDERPNRPRIETFIVGGNWAAGERMQWVVKGRVWKASWALPPLGGESGEGIGEVDALTGDSCEELLISEVVIPAFTFDHHEFLSFDGLVGLVGREKAEEMRWLVRGEDIKNEEEEGKI